MAAISQQEILRHRLFQIDFLTTQTGAALVTLVYHKQLNDEWIEAARPLREQFGIDIIGRARKQKIVLDQEWVTEELNVAGKSWHYQQVEGSFTQPNAGINEKMLGWAKQVTEPFTGDLVELYCGNGNFTCVLAENFDGYWPPRSPKPLSIQPTPTLPPMASIMSPSPECRAKSSPRL